MPFALTEAWLTSRLFAFRVGEERTLLAPSLRFDPNGRISGYTHYNEAAWRLEGGVLLVLRADGTPSCVAEPLMGNDTTICLAGPFLGDDEGTVHTFCEDPPQSPLPTVFSFDLFDTLVARRCKDPLAVFRLIEEETALAGFAVLRQELEACLFRSGPYGLDDIYRLLQDATGWSDAICAMLRARELALEWEQLFPIRDMVARVSPGDLIISDMYLPRAFIRRLIDEKCGLPETTLHLSNHGKHHGAIWSRIQATQRILRHHGDNVRADIHSARHAGVAAELVTISHWSRGEQVLVDAGLAPFAHVLREARLNTFERDLRLHRARHAQLVVNIPLLILASVQLLSVSRRAAADTLLMSARDCNLWVGLMAWMAARASHRPAVRYVTTSRLLLLSGSPDYAAYVDRLRGARTIIADVCGTGRSLSHFIDATGRAADTWVFLVFSTRVVENFVGALTQNFYDVTVERMSEQPTPMRLGFEALNTSLEDRSMRIGADVFEREPHEFGLQAATVIGAMRAAFGDFMAVLDASGIVSMPEDIAPDRLAAALSGLVGAFTTYRDILAPVVADSFAAEPQIAAAAFAGRRQDGPASASFALPRS